MHLIFVVSHHRRKYFNAELFPNYGIYARTYILIYIYTYISTYIAANQYIHTYVNYASNLRCSIGIGIITIHKCSENIHMSTTCSTVYWQQSILHTYICMYAPVICSYHSLTGGLMDVFKSTLYFFTSKWTISSSLHFAAK